jgi:flavin reductase (DIM6/NTAB) family NADH-FMN oxidoreductase RutF
MSVIDTTAEAFRNVMRHWASGVTIVTTPLAKIGYSYGMTVSSFTSVSFEPLLVSVCLLKTFESSQAVIDAGKFAVSLLAADQEPLSNRFAGADPAFPIESDRFVGLNTHTALTGAPILAGAIGWLDCNIWAVYDGSTHHIVIGQVVAANFNDIDDPLLYYNRAYRRLLPMPQDNG